MFSASYDFDNPSEVLQITCFTGTKVQILTPEELQAEEAFLDLRRQVPKAPSVCRLKLLVYAVLSYECMGP